MKIVFENICRPTIWSWRPDQRDIDRNTLLIRTWILFCSTSDALNLLSLFRNKIAQIRSFSLWQITEAPLFVLFYFSVFLSLWRKSWRKDSCLALIRKSFLEIWTNYVTYAHLHFILLSNRGEDKQLFWNKLRK